MHNNVERVVMLCPDLHEVGGIGAVSRMAFAALQSQGHPGEVWSLGAPSRNGGALNLSTWEVRYASGKKVLPAIWGLKAGLHTGKHTLIVVMHLHLAPVTLPLVVRGAQLAVFLHGIEAWTPLTGLRAVALGCADMLVANSQFTARKFAAANPRFAGAKIRICQLGAPEREPGLAGLAEKAPFALIAGRLSSQERYKGHDLLLEIWPEVRKRFPNARLLVVGDGDDRPRLEKKAADLGVDDVIVFCGGVDDERLCALYGGCTFFVMPSSREGFGLAFVEAMRAGKACIAAHGAAEEIVAAAETGLVVASDDRDALLKAVMRLFADPALCERMGRAGRDRFVARFTETQFRSRFLTALGLRPDVGWS
jgi:phosphatidylinositol alpha-1,6-mannosyltransferase